MIYTAIVGDRDPPRADIKCFRESRGMETPRLNARIYKVLSHLFIPEERSVWVDGNIKAKVSEDDLFNHFSFNDPDLIVFAHPYRKNIAEELKYVLEEGIAENPERLQGFDEVWDLERFNLYESGVLLRKHNERTTIFNEIWWSLICRWSERDQLTLPIAIDRAQSRCQIKVTIVCADLRDHVLFEFKPHNVPEEIIMPREPYEQHT